MANQTPHEILEKTINTISNWTHNLPVKTEELHKLLQVPSAKDALLIKINSLLTKCLSSNWSYADINTIDISWFDKFFSILDHFHENKDKHYGVKHVYKFLGKLVWNDKEDESEKINKILEETIKKDYNRRLLLPFNTLVRPYGEIIPNYKRLSLQTVIKILDTPEISTNEKIATINRVLPDTI